MSTSLCVSNLPASATQEMFKSRWDYLPGQAASDQPCDPAVARRFLQVTAERLRRAHCGIVGMRRVAPPTKAALTTVDYRLKSRDLTYGDRMCHMQRSPLRI